jgi:hypothetical protein
MSHSTNAPLPFDQLAKALETRRSVYGFISGLRLDRVAPGEAWSSLPYRPVFIGDVKTGVLHGGVVTAMVAFEAQAWQDDATKPIASAFGHLMLRKTPGMDEE